MDVEKLIRAGETLGYSGDELKTFIDGERAREREQKAVEREQRAEEREILKLKLELENSRRDSDASLSQPTQNYKVPKLPAFVEGRDEIDAYLNRFERYARAQNWPEEIWATNLSALLSGKALETYYRLNDRESTNYRVVRKALLERFSLNSEGCRKKFRSAKPENGESCAQFTSRLRSYFENWLKLAEYDQTYDHVVELLLMEQFFNISSQSMVTFIREHRPKRLSEVLEVADRYVESRSGWHTNSVPKSNVSSKPYSSRTNTGTSKPTDGQPGQRPSKDGCFFCGKPGHRAKDCRKRIKEKKLAAGLKEIPIQTDIDEDSVSRGASSRDHTRRDDRADRETRGSDLRGGDIEKVCLLMDFCVTCKPDESEISQLTDGKLLSVIAACRAKFVKDMPVVKGMFNGAEVDVLRDSGCSTAIAKRSLVRPDQLTDQVRYCLLIDCTLRKFAVAKIEVDTPYYTGSLEVLVVDNPLYDLILGNLPGVRDASDPQPDWKPIAKEQALAVQTRLQQKKAEKPIQQLIVPGQVDGISAEEFRREQQADASLSGLREKVTSGDEKISRTGNKTKYILKSDLLYRQFTARDTGDTTLQLAVPEKYRKHVLALAHESILGGHLGSKKTIEKISNHFYWPGVQADARRYCRSCDECQRSLPKGKVSKVPLGQTPLIDEPFRRIAVDIIGPIAPMTSRGNRYILTVVDYATRYPEAIALKNIDTATVAEALLSIFSRVGFPREMLSDRGAQFTSDLMKEISRLVSIKHLKTTPYHPACNGLVERFNGTLKSMLKKMSEERPSDWDRYIDSLLFAYRETPQDSTGFAPFELLYGREVRGPLMILRELWTDEEAMPETKTSYQYVIDLRERMEKTCELARQELMKSHERYRKNYNKKAKTRKFKVGDEVLLLLPTDRNKLLMHWKGPFRVVKTVGNLDYRIDTGHRVTTFHANLLRKYHRRDGDDQKPETEPDQGNDVGETTTPLNVAATSVVIDGEDDDTTDPHDCRESVREELLHSPSLSQTQTFKDVVVNPEIDADQMAELQCLLRKYSDTLTDVPGITKAGHHDIILSDQRPIRSRPYPLPHSLRETVKNEVKEMLELGVIEPSSSPYASPVVIVAKKDGSNRFCCDYRKLNMVTVKDAEPIPDQDEIFAKLAKDHYFSKIDLTKGYWQVPLADQAKPLTAFITPDGLYQYRTMPFGLVNAPASFSRVMRSVLRGIPCVDNFIDDILIHTKSWEEHMEVLGEVLRRLRKANLKAKPSKCFLGFETIEFLGHQVSQGCVKPNLDKIEAIVKAPRPQTKKQLRSFLGLAGYYRKFVPNFSAIAVPLTDRTKKKLPNIVQWEEPQELAFQTLKAALANAPILHLPDVEKPFILRTDASGTGIGGVLMQEVGNQKFPVAYASKKLLPREKNYSTIEKECLAVVWAVQKFEPYLYGREFVLEVDHEPLRSMKNGKVANGRVMRWSLALQQYRYRVEAIKGKDNVGADYLSRID